MKVISLLKIIKLINLKQEIDYVLESLKSVYKIASFPVLALTPWRPVGHLFRPVTMEDFGRGPPLMIALRVASGRHTMANRNQMHLTALGIVPWVVSAAYP